MFGHLRHIFEQDVAITLGFVERLAQTLKGNLLRVGEIRKERAGQFGSHITLSNRRRRQPRLGRQPPIGGDTAQRRQHLFRGQKRRQMT